VGVAVVDDQDRILVVQERSGPAAARGKDFWKVPTGLVNHNESIADAAEREVMEETGIRVQFEGVVAFREQNNSGVERKTDLFFMCKARPLSSDISMQESELANCK
jgi:ADP-ribose pyrophosphatase YjhB (NUDIX family)